MEREYNRKRHAESRTLRRSDATVSIEGRHFEVPGRYQHLQRIAVRYAVWDLTTVHQVDEHTGSMLCRLYPQDKTKTPAARARSGLRGAARTTGLRRGPGSPRRRC